MNEHGAPASSPMGRLDAIDVAGKKLTFQTEFFSSPTWRVETKVYLGGALKKVYSTPLDGVDESALQKRVDEAHQERLNEVVAGLRGLKK